MHILQGFIKDQKLKTDPLTGKVMHPTPGKKYTVYEGTSGNTGISLGLVANFLGFNAKIYLNDDLANEKVSSVHIVPSARSQRLRVAQGQKRQLQRH
jgi:cysteine synthase